MAAARPARSVDAHQGHNRSDQGRLHHRARRRARLDRARSTRTQTQLNATTDPPAPFSTIAVDPHNADDSFFGVGAQYGTNRQAPLGNIVWHGTKNAAAGFDLTPLSHVADLDVPINNVGGKVTVGGEQSSQRAGTRSRSGDDAVAQTGTLDRGVSGRGSGD